MEKNNSIDPDVVKELTNKVGEYAAFWNNHSEDLDKVVKQLLLDFCEKNTFDSEQYVAYRDGIATLPQFFELCLQSVEKAAKE